MASSKKESRQNRIMTALDANPSIRVRELAEMLEVSTETVRRDLSELDDAGRINRTYGGAVRGQVSEPHLAERLNLHVEARQAIGRAAARLIEGVDTIFVGGGATTLHFVRVLRGIDRQISVLTPALRVAAELSVNPYIQVMCLPGLYEGKEGLVTGPETLESIERFRAPVAVMGASGVDVAGVSEAMLGPSEVYAAMIRCSEMSYILADQSKFGLRALKIITPWRANIHLVADAAPTGPLGAALRDSEADVTVVTPEPT